MSVKKRAAGFNPRGRGELYVVSRRLVIEVGWASTRHAKKRRVDDPTYKT